MVVALAFHVDFFKATNLFENCFEVCFTRLRHSRIFQKFYWCMFNFSVTRKTHSTFAGYYKVYRKNEFENCSVDFIDVELLFLCFRLTVNSWRPFLQVRLLTTLKKR